jgi:hypothetical protein
LDAEGIVATAHHTVGRSPDDHAGADRPPELDVGDRVLALGSLGGFLRPKVPAGMPGIVVGRHPAAGLRVRFVNGCTLDVDSAYLGLPDLRDSA